eukprot:6193035-Pleurochrysis_carterae.AAC.1
MDVCVRACVRALSRPHRVHGALVELPRRRKVAVVKLEVRLVREAVLPLPLVLELPDELDRLGQVGLGLGPARVARVVGADREQRVGEERVLAQLVARLERLVL